MPCVCVCVWVCVRGAGSQRNGEETQRKSQRVLRDLTPTSRTLSSKGQPRKPAQEKATQMRALTWSCTVNWSNLRMFSNVTPPAPVGRGACCWGG
jgi:hypothetical protein